MHSVTFTLEPPLHTTGGARMAVEVKCEMIQSVDEAETAGEQAAQIAAAFLTGYGNADINPFPDAA